MLTLAVHECKTLENFIGDVTNIRLGEPGRPTGDEKIKNQHHTSGESVHNYGAMDIIIIYSAAAAQWTWYRPGELILQL